MSCTALGPNPALMEVITCGIEMGAGGPVIAILLLFVIMIYGLYKFKIPFVAAVPLGALLLFVFAGAGNRLEALGGIRVFESLLLSVILFGAIVIILLFWRFRK